MQNPIKNEPGYVKITFSEFRKFRRDVWPSNKTPINVKLSQSAFQMKFLIEIFGFRFFWEAF